MSAHVLLNLLKRKRDKIRGLPSILSLCRNEFNKVKYKSTNVRLYLSYGIKITLKSLFCNKKVIILSLYMQRFMDVITFPENL